MTPERFTEAHERLGMSRAAFARALGINKNTAMFYASGKHEIPIYIALAVAALEYGIEPAA